MLKVDLKELESLYLSGVMVPDISKKLGCSKRYVHTKVKELNLPRRSKYLKRGANGRITEKSLEEKFQDKVEFTEVCWIWKGSKTRHNYGVILHQGKSLLAHRVSYELFKGEIPKGLFICHKCDNPSCVNPEHLFAGTPRDNLMDCIKKGRRPDYTRDGKTNPRARLTWDEVDKIREDCLNSGLSKCEIARRNGVSDSAIRKIVKGTMWKINGRETGVALNDNRKDNVKI